MNCVEKKCPLLMKLDSGSNLCKRYGVTIFNPKATNCQEDNVIPFTRSVADSYHLERIRYAS